MLKVGICDDKQATCEEIKGILLDLGEENRVSIDTRIWLSGEELCQSLMRGETIDLLFLDIELITMSGVRVSKFIRETLRDTVIEIVFISYKESYAMELFEIQPLHFLIKPVGKEKIEKVLQIYFRIKGEEGLYFQFRKGTELYQYLHRDILCFSSANRKVLITVKDGVDEFYGKLSKIAAELPADYIQIHQSHIVNQMHVVKYAYESVVLSNGVFLNISRTYRKPVRDRIVKWGREQDYGCF